LGNDSNNCRHKRSKNGDIIARRVNDNNGKRKPLEILLVFKIAIDRDQNVELGCSESQQLAVFDAGPASLGNRFDLMAGNIAPQRAGHALVKQYSHRQSGALSPARAPQWQAHA
jgi:hypothetical protein